MEPFLSKVCFNDHSKQFLCDFFLFKAIPPYDVVQVDDNDDEVSDTVSGKSCYTAAIYSDSYMNITGGSYNDYPEKQICTYVFGTAVCCSGEYVSPVLTDTCAIYDCFDHKWKPIQDLPSIFRSHKEMASTVIREKGRDVGWLLSGGRCKYNTAYQGIHMERKAENQAYSRAKSI